MEFRTVIKVPALTGKIDHSKRGLSVGSCFAENISARLKRAKFRIESNPFGVLYNPFSIADALQRIAEGRLVDQEELFSHAGLWKSFSFHGSFSDQDRERAMQRMNQAIERGAKELDRADYIILTFGSAMVYELLGESGLPAPPFSPVVANCHKVHPSVFSRRLLTVDEIVRKLKPLFEGPLKDKHTILTVSPVRHLKEGFGANSVSKATLLLAIDSLVREYSGAEYFPAYEIVNDDLRDYRFYADDMIHPSAQAVDYIWDHFRQSTMSCETVALIDELERLTTAAEHRPFNADTPEHKAFLAAMHAKASSLAAGHPDIDLRGEIEYFGRGL